MTRKPILEPSALCAISIAGMTTLFPAVPAHAQKQAPPGLAELQTNHLQTLLEQQQKESTADALSTLQGDPEEQKIFEGSWTYYQEGDPPIPGQMCAATFSSQDGMLSVAALGGRKDPAVLLFVGKDVPVPSEQTMIRATLHQTASSPQTVAAYNFTIVGGKVGAIAFALPSFDAAISGLLDESEIAVDVNNERVYSLKYNKGDMTKAELKKCANGK